MYKTIFHERINIAIKKRNIKQVEIANKTGLSRGQINGYINGVCKPKNDKLIVLADVLSVSPMWLMGFEVPMSANDNATRDKIIKIINELEAENLDKVLLMLQMIFDL